MRFKRYINELFTRDIELKVDAKWNKWRGSFPVANDIYTVSNYRVGMSVMTTTLTDKELKKITGKDMKDVEKESQRIKKDREEGRQRIPINFAWMEMEKFFDDHNIWIVGFSSKKFGDKILDIRTKKEVLTIYSGVKKGVEEFIRSVKPPFIIIDAKDPKRLSIYKRFVDEIVKRSGYKIIGSQRKIDYGEGVTTKGWILFSGKP